MLNEIQLVDDLAILFVSRRGAEPLQVKLDAEDLPLIDLENDRYVLCKKKDGTPQFRSTIQTGQVFLHRKFFPAVPHGAKLVHYDGDPLNYRKNNLALELKDGTMQPYIYATGGGC